MQLLTTLVLCRPHGMMEFWNSEHNIDIVPIVQDFNIPLFHCSIIPIVSEAN